MFQSVICSPSTDELIHLEDYSATVRYRDFIAFPGSIFLGTYFCKLYLKQARYGFFQSCRDSETAECGH